MKTHIVESLPICSLLIAIIAGIGYFIHAPTLHNWGSDGNDIPFPTCVCLICNSIAILAVLKRTKFDK